MHRVSKSIEEVVKGGLCIGCGLCEAVTRGRVNMKMTEYGSLRPTPLDAFSANEESQLLAACPGVTVEPKTESDLTLDPIWGSYSEMCYAWAGNPEIRFRAATGGVLTALGVYLLRSNRASFILHTEVDPDQPMRSRWVFSESPEQVIVNSGSRYGPTAPLAGLIKALDRNQPFAIIAKPCDLNAVHRFSKVDSRVDQLCVARLVMVCGGQSRLAKSQALLAEFEIKEEDLSLFRYRGYGNPGPARIETTDGRAFEKTYLELWEDEAGWQLETRCKLCPDALGEAADIAVADVWPGGSPTGEDAGFNGIIVRSKAGTSLVNAATEAGDLKLGGPISPAQLNDFQPHQVRKKESLSARFEGLNQAGLAALDTPGLRLAELGQRQDKQKRIIEIEGTIKRVNEGRITE